jgi:hypothetical protein
MATAPATINALPTAPNPDDRVTFNARAYAYTTALMTVVTQQNAASTNVYNNATEAYNSANTATSQANTATSQASAATTQATNAANSATSALNAPGTNATSTTSLAVGTGAKSLTIQTDKSFTVGQAVVIADTAAPGTNWMWGQITAYTSGTGALTVQVSDIGGSGTKTAWTISISASPRTATNYQKFYDSATTNALNIANGVHQRWAPNTGAQTLSISGWPPAGTLGELLIEGVNLGAATITWPTINWIKTDGTTTTTFTSNGIALQAAGIDWVFLWSRDGGTTIYGKVVR